MLIKNPINPYPQNIAIDPNKASISFTFMGSRLGSYQIKVYHYATKGVSESLIGQEFHIYTSKVINLDKYVYNNTPINVNISFSEILKIIPEKFQLNNTYTWEVIMSPYNNWDEDLELKGTEDSFSSLHYYFETSLVPRIIDTPNLTENSNASFIVNGEIYDYNPEINVPRIEIKNLKSRNINIEGYCPEGDIKYYYFELVDDNNNQIEQTNKTFSNKIEYSFSGLLSSKNYKLNFFAVSQKDQYVNIIFDINVSYDLKSDISNPPILTYNENEANVKVKWIKDSTALGKASGEYQIDNGMVNINTGTIVYDNISSLPIIMDKNNFTVAIKTTINDDTTKIFDYINNEILYEVYLENYKIYLKYGNINLSNKTIKEISNFKFKNEVLFGIQDYDEPENDTGYMWFDNEEIPDSNSKYLLISKQEEKQIQIILQNNNGKITCTIN